MAAWTRPKYALFVPLSPASTELRKIPRKHRNPMAVAKFRGSAENYAFRGKLVPTEKQQTWDNMSPKVNFLEQYILQARCWVLSTGWTA